MQKKQHYVYLIELKEEYHHFFGGVAKKYIGKRSCNCSPEEDVKYWSSSSDKKARKWMNKYYCTKKILAVFSTSQEAVAHEIELHNEFDVGRNPIFWNLVKQNAIGFDFTGGTQSAETRATRKAFYQTEEGEMSLAKQAATRKAFYQTEEGKSILAQAVATRKAFYQTEEGKAIRAQTGVTLKALYQTEEGKAIKAQIGATLKALYQTEEGKANRAQIGATLKALYQTEEGKSIRAQQVATLKAFNQTEAGKSSLAQAVASRIKQNPKYIKLYNFTKNEGVYRVLLADMRDLFEATTKNQKFDLTRTIKKMCKEITKYSDVNLSMSVEHGRKKGRWTPIIAFLFKSTTKITNKNYIIPHDENRISA